MKRVSYFLLFICLFVAYQTNATEKAKFDIVVGTYAYKGLDRQTAVQPIADAVEAATHLNTDVRVYDSPTELAQAYFSGEAQVVVPNLAGFAQIAAKQKNGVLMFVPDDEGSSYKSSVVMSSETVSFTQSLSAQKQNIGMVWKDSTSGAILGKAWLETQLHSGESLAEERIIYLGRHENVLTALLAKKIEIGVLATDIYLKQKHSLPEIWRSAAIPFGPVLCSQTIKRHCDAVQQYVMNNLPIHNRVLAHLIKGWPEFATAQQLVVPTWQPYEAFVKHFEANN